MFETLLGHAIFLYLFLSFPKLITPVAHCDCQGLFAAAAFTCTNPVNHSLNSLDCSCLRGPSCRCTDKFCCLNLLRFSAYAGNPLTHVLCISMDLLDCHFHPPICTPSPQRALGPALLHSSPCLSPSTRASHFQLPSNPRYAPRFLDSCVVLPSSNLLDSLRRNSQARRATPLMPTQAGSQTCFAGTFESR